ncbi:ribonuclease III [Sulfurospirillum deleyianum]|uniref:Ribonuclease 3 n=1 Tax=Sulfurospirillum deleyianum (strain ATCC 51133 / DSM 6946 / 5175) TaxID=525898 RepID=D1B4H0_SULD5|nr:ribonuclease III [Sulfurospirillum deleyianum]ACZ12990.1 ribonuclease III [Sulfurospirillum deleyianum DSM 6946]
MQQKLEALQKRLGYQFKNQNLIIEALTHKSSKQPYNNERLEFLGDAVLDLIVGEYLYKEFLGVAEGELSKLRASLVNEKSFEKLARLLHLGESIYISLAEENNNGREKPSLLSNAFEAIIGALYLEAGLEKARTLAISLLEEAYPKIDMDAIFRDHKTTLQELTQAHFGVTPEYRLVRSFGPDHQKEFEIAVSVRGSDLSLASGKSKKEAQQKAALLALEILKKEIQ